MKLSPDEKLDPREVLRDLDRYRPRRHGWTWRRRLPHQEVGPFVLEDISEPLARSVTMTSLCVVRWRVGAFDWDVWQTERTL